MPTTLPRPGTADRVLDLAVAGILDEQAGRSLLGAVAFGALRNSDGKTSNSDGASTSGLVQVQPVNVTGNPLPEFPGNGSADPAVGLEAPVLKGRSFDGSKVTVGGTTAKPTLVMFMAHWCPHCQQGPAPTPGPRRTRPIGRTSYRP